jgi:RNA polymerase sigma-70 factor (ECF subfamily)
MESRRIYCLVPIELAGRLHDSLRRHFRDDPEVEVVIEQRHRDRRGGAERRKGADATSSRSGEERRKVRNPSGRRIADRRAVLVPMRADDSPALPRRASRHAGQIVFVERLAPSAEKAEDADTARLVTRIQAGERELFTELYLRYFDRIYTYLRAILSDIHEAEDVCQQVFLETSIALGSYERRSQPFRAWLFVIARNQALMRLRKQSRVEPVAPAELDREGARASETEAELSVLDWLTDQDLMIFVDRLPIAQRQVLVLRYQLDLTMDEIAKILGRTTVDVRALHHRAVRFLEKRLVAIGRTSHHGTRARMHRCPRPANVLRARRFALR